MQRNDRTIEKELARALGHNGRCCRSVSRLHACPRSPAGETAWRQMDRGSACEPLRPLPRVQPRVSEKTLENAIMRSTGANVSHPGLQRSTTQMAPWLPAVQSVLRCARDTWVQQQFKVTPLKD